MEKIKGLIDAPFTPFYENGEVNYEPIEAYAKLLVKNGLKGVFINGSSGEGYMLTDGAHETGRKMGRSGACRIQGHRTRRQYLRKIEP